MEDQPSGDNVQENGNEPSPTASKSIKEPTGDATQQVRGESTNQQIANLEDRIRSAEKWMIGLTGAIAFFALCSVIVGFLQWSVIKSGGKDTRSLADAAKTQAAQMTNVSDAADKIKNAAQNMVAQDQRIADNSEAALKATTKQAKSALDSSIDSSHLDQRAWLVVSTLAISAEPSQEDGASVTVSLANTGRTPALKLINQSKLFFLDIDPAGANFNLPTNPRSRAIVPPGVSGVQFTTGKLKFKSLSQVGLYESGVYKVYVQALIRYRDVFGKSHWTSVCAYHTYGARLDYFQFCEHGNEVDGEQAQEQPN